jgi:hypothetical protein
MRSRTTLFRDHCRRRVSCSCTTIIELQRWHFVESTPSTFMSYGSHRYRYVPVPGTGAPVVMQKDQEDSKTGTRFAWKFRNRY